LESGPWTAILAGHNHLHQQLGDHTWHVGAPLRTSWGESRYEPGYMVFDDGASAGAASWMTFHPTEDMRLVRLDLNGDNPWVFGDVRGALVRVRVSCSEERANELAHSGELLKLREELMSNGAAKVIGPQLDVQRERRARSDLHTET